jgi:hypothetical protein
VDQRELAVGDSLKVSIEFRHIGNESMALGNPSFSTPEKFEIGNFTSSFTNVAYENGKEVVTSTTQFSLKATKPGEETLGPAVLIYQDAQGKKREIQSNSVVVTVAEKSGFSLFGKKKSQPPPAAPPVPAVADGLKDVKPLMPEDHFWLRVLFWSFVVALIFGLVLWRLIRSDRRPGLPPPPQGKAAELKDRWKKLGDEDLSSKEFCEGLSSLVRESLQYRFGFPAVNYTTEEVLKALAKVKSTDDERVAAEKCLKTTDRVLHADGNLTGRDNLRALCSALLPKVPKN